MFAELLGAELFPFALVFLRIGAALMLLPTLGESTIPGRVRLHLALAFSVIVTPFLADKLPGLPPTIMETALLVLYETLVGVFFGVTARIMFTALHVAGMVFAFHSSLAAATMFDPNQTAQSSMAGNLMNLLAIMLVFATDMHHLMLRALVDTYVLLPAGVPPPIADTTEAITRTVSDSFRIGFQISAPVVVAGFLLYLGAGLLNRLMPQMMVFFVILPIQIGVGFGILMIALAAIMYGFLTFFGDGLNQFVVPL